MELWNNSQILLQLQNYPSTFEQNEITQYKIMSNAKMFHKKKNVIAMVPLSFCSLSNHADYHKSRRKTIDVFFVGSSKDIEISRFTTFLRILFSIY